MVEGPDAEGGAVLEALGVAAATGAVLLELLVLPLEKLLLSILISACMAGTEVEDVAELATAHDAKDAGAPTAKTLAHRNRIHAKT